MEGVSSLLERACNMSIVPLDQWGGPGRCLWKISLSGPRTSWASHTYRREGSSPPW